MRCLICGHYYPRPMPQLIDTNEGYQSHEVFWRNHEPSEVLRHFKRLLADLKRVASCADPRVVDVGSGRGLLLVAARELGLRAVGVETSREFAEYACSAHGVDVRNCALEEAGFTPESFDIAILASVLEHLYAPGDVLQQIGGILRACGLLYVDVPNDSGLVNLLGDAYFALRGKDWTTHLSPTFPPYHVHGFTPGSLRKLLESTGFRLEMLRTFRARVARPSRRDWRTRLEYYAECAVSFVDKVTVGGSFMDAIARKV